MPLSEKTKYEVEIKVIYKWAELIDGTGEENSLSKCWEKFEAATLRTEHRVGTLSEENLPLLAEIVESIAKEYEEISQAEALEHAQALAKMTWFKKCIFEALPEGRMPKDLQSDVTSRKVRDSVRFTYTKAKGIYKKGDCTGAVRVDLTPETGIILPQMKRLPDIVIKGRVSKLLPNKLTMLNPFIPIEIIDGHCVFDTIIHQLFDLIKNKKYHAFRALTENIENSYLKRLTETLLLSRSINLATEYFRVRLMEEHALNVRDQEETRHTTEIWIADFFRFHTVLCKLAMCPEPHGPIFAMTGPNLGETDARIILGLLPEYFCPQCGHICWVQYVLKGSCLLFTFMKPLMPLETIEQAPRVVAVGGKNFQLQSLGIIGPKYLSYN